MVGSLYKHAADTGANLEDFNVTTAFFHHYWCKCPRQVPEELRCHSDRRAVHGGNWSYNSFCCSHI